MQRIEGLFAAVRTAGQHLEWRGRAGLPAYAQEVGQQLCNYFGCSHASLWWLGGRAGQQRLSCLGGSVAWPGVAGEVCEQQAFPLYFERLLSQGMFRCVDTHADARLRGLEPPRWRAMLDMGGQVNGQMAGVIALAQADQPREWTRAEELDLRRITAKIFLQLHAWRPEPQPA